MKPSKYDGNPESFGFIRNMPMVWDETVHLEGKCRHCVVGDMPDPASNNFITNKVISYFQDVDLYFIAVVYECYADIEKMMKRDVCR